MRTGAEAVLGHDIETVRAVSGGHGKYGTADDESSAPENQYAQPDRAGSYASLNLTCSAMSGVLSACIRRLLVREDLMKHVYMPGSHDQMQGNAFIAGLHVTRLPVPDGLFGGSVRMGWSGGSVIVGWQGGGAGAGHM